MELLESLTQKQRQVFEYIRDLIETRGYGPTVRDIGDHFQIRSPNGVVGHLNALERKGLIHRARNKSRGIELAEEYREATRGLPLAGEVAAGPTQLAFEQNERIDFTDLFSGDQQFVLRVRGDSMIEAQIADGDMVVVRRQKRARTGQMVVAQTDDDEATLKFWFPEPAKNRIRLQPANAEMGPIYVKSARVLGVVVGVVRRL